MVHDPHSEARTLDPGTVVRGRYVVEEKIAEGGMASIHRTLDRKTGKYVALKALYPFYCEQPVVCTRFLDEGRIQRYLDHPNIIDVYEIVETAPLAIIMEYIQGPTLEEYLAERGPLNTLELLNLMLPVLSAVGFAHQKGIIHRDIKPSNILLEETPTALVPKVMDFGVAKVARGQDLTADGTTVGTLHYMSPEQIVGSKSIDGRADIYSLGVTLYKLCTGEVPFNAATEFALMMAQVEAPPTPPRQLRPEISGQFEAIILRTLAKKPSGRFQNIGELTAALLELKEDVEAFDSVETETLTLRFSDELLRHAMMANEVAVDRTSELDILESAEFTDLIVRTTSDGETLEQAALGSVAPTMQLDRERLKAKMRADRSQSRGLRGGDLHGDDLRRIQAAVLDTKDTRPIERETTREQNSPDSRAFTLPFQRPSMPAKPSDTMEDRPTNPREPLPAHLSADFDDPTVEARLPSASYPAAPQPSAAHPQGVGDKSSEDDSSGVSPRVSDSFYEIDIRDDISQDQGMGVQAEAPRSVPQPEKYGAKDAVDGFNSPAFAELRARAAGTHSQTEVSRAEIRDEFDRLTKSEEETKSATSKKLIAAIFLLSAAIIIAFLWSQFSK